MNLAKQHLDIGLFSTKRDEQLAFWQQTVGLPYDHMGKLGGGMQQHRHHMNGSILKMNHSRGAQLAHVVVGQAHRLLPEGQLLVALGREKTDVEVLFGEVHVETIARSP